MSTIPATKNKIALFIAILFHVLVLTGIAFTPYKQWFINNTPFTLIIMASLLVITQPAKNIFFYVFAIFVFIAGTAVEILAIRTGSIFGQYTYGSTLGAQYYGVPLLIGVNWFIIIYCSGIIIHQLDEWIQKKLVGGAKLSPVLQWTSFIIDAALLATFFDWVLEPVAVKLNFWHWRNNSIPLFNYISWFMVSALLLAVFKLLPFRKHNQFAIHLFIIQILFFIALQTFL